MHTLFYPQILWTKFNNIKIIKNIITSHAADMPARDHGTFATAACFVPGALCL
jgi:hypothetical protein